MGMRVTRLRSVFYAGAVSAIFLSIGAGDAAHAQSQSLPAVTVDAPDREAVRRGQASRNAA
jgi:hypothetical protein